MPGYETLPKIAKQFNRSPITIFRWIHNHGLPACKLPNGNWFITDSLIDAWVIARNRAQKAEKDDVSTGED